MGRIDYYGPASVYFIDKTTTKISTKTINPIHDCVISEAGIRDRLERDGSISPTKSIRRPLARLSYARKLFADYSAKKDINNIKVNHQTNNMSLMNEVAPCKDISLNLGANFDAKSTRNLNQNDRCCCCCCSRCRDWQDVTTTKTKTKSNADARNHLLKQKEEQEEQEEWKILQPPNCTITKKNNQDFEANNLAIDAESPFVDKDVDAGYAWVILITMFFINASTFGTGRAYGLIFERLARGGHYTRTEASLPFAISGAVENMGGMLTCILVFRTSWRLVVFLGTLLTTLGHFAAYFCRTVIMDVITIGIMCGLGLSFISIPFFQINNAYFVKYRTTAFGASLAGAAVGIYYVSPICEYTLEHYSAHTAYLVLSVILFPNVPLSLLLRPKNTTPDAISINQNNQMKLIEEKHKQPKNGSPKQLKSNTNYQKSSSLGYRRHSQQVTPSESLRTIKDKYDRKCSCDLSSLEMIKNSKIESVSANPDLVSHSLMSRVRTRSCRSVTFSFDHELNKKKKKNVSENDSWQSSFSDSDYGSCNWLMSIFKKKICTLPEAKPGRYIPIMQFDCHIGFSTDQNTINNNIVRSSLNGCIGACQGMTSLVRVSSGSLYDDNQKRTRCLCPYNVKGNVKCNELSSGIPIIDPTDTVGITGTTTIVNNKLELDYNYDNSSCSEDDNEIAASEIISDGGTLACARNILTNPYFHLIWATQVLYCWLNFILGVIIVDFGKDRGLQSNVAGTLIIYWATGQLIGRVMLGMIIDLRLLSYRNYTILCLFVISILLYIMVALGSNNLEFYSSVLSFIIMALSAFIALLYLLFNGLMVTYVDGSLISVSIGISSFIGSFLLLPRASVIGYFRDTLGNYDSMITMLSLASLTFTLFWIILPRLLHLANELVNLITSTDSATNKSTSTNVADKIKEITIDI